MMAAVGLHPELVVSHGAELEAMWPSLGETRYVGEIGLDYATTDKEIRRKQQDVFRRILERCAEHGSKVLTVHSRRASADVIAMVGDRFPGTVILHWFSGPLKDLRTAAQRGMYFSVNPAMARSQSGQRLVAEMPRDRVLTETDGPFVKTGSRPAKPSDVAGVLDWLAASWRLTPDEVRQAIVGNLKRAIGPCEQG
jgi:TatD DNase family protein